MALAKCRDCGATVSTKAKACPACGRPMKGGSKRYGCGCLMLIGIGLLFVIAMATPKTHQPPGTPVVPAPSPKPANGPGDRGSVVLTPNDFGGSWPLKAERITLMCEPAMGELSGRPAHHILIVADGVTYAVNGTARGRATERGWKDFTELLTSEDEFTFGAKLVQRGLALCH